jgi:hypothetical protein
MVLPLGAGSDRGERDAAAVLIDFDDPNLQHVADSDDLVRVLDVPVGQAAKPTAPTKVAVASSFAAPPPR